jgi:hypothetical protein
MVRVVHDRREDVDGLHDGKIVAQPVDGGVVRGTRADEQVWVGRYR